MIKFSNILSIPLDPIGRSDSCRKGLLLYKGVLPFPSYQSHLWVSRAWTPDHVSDIAVAGHPQKTGTVPSLCTAKQRFNMLLVHQFLRNYWVTTAYPPGPPVIKHCYGKSPKNGASFMGNHMKSPNFWKMFHVFHVWWHRRHGCHGSKHHQTLLPIAHSLRPSQGFMWADRWLNRRNRLPWCGFEATGWHLFWSVTESSKRWNYQAWVILWAPKDGKIGKVFPRWCQLCFGGYSTSVSLLLSCQIPMSIL